MLNLSSTEPTPRNTPYCDSASLPTNGMVYSDSVPPCRSPDDAHISLVKPLPEARLLASLLEIIAGNIS